jgi:uncharacterized phiE125 gp8 family phage protein
MLQLITAPAVEPLSVEEAKLHCKVEDTADDGLVRSMIQAAREVAEHKTGRALIEQRWERVLDGFPCVLPLGHPPLIAVESLKYVDVGGVEQTLSPSGYQVDGVQEPGRILAGYSQSWPSTRSQVNAVRARFIAGYACGMTASPGTDVLTHSGLRTLANTDPIRFSNSGGALPAPLVAGPTYYASNVAGNTFKVSATSGGAAIDITDAGTGSHYLGAVPRTILDWMLIAIAMMYEHREPVVTDAVVSELKFVDRLLDRYTVPRL